MEPAVVFAEAAGAAAVSAGLAAVFAEAADGAGICSLTPGFNFFGLSPGLAASRALIVIPWFLAIVSG